MSRTVFIAGILLGISGLQAQERSGRSSVYQVFGPGFGVRALDEGFNNRIVRGKPFSATEERRSLQILGNGTRIENLQTNRLFRDTEGRTRSEEMNGTVTILDPVASVRMELDPSSKTARKATYVVFPSGLQVARSGVQINPATTQGVTAETTENLAQQVVNGVAAQGVRTVMTIPKGQIGNDREIKVLTERWVSNDLQMLIKSNNSDPRFGETSYQLTGIVEREPDASLFQVPAGYNVVTGGLAATPGGGRSPSLPVVPGGRSATPGRNGRAGDRPAPAEPSVNQPQR